jgi:hypothetical protein
MKPITVECWQRRLFTRKAIIINGSSKRDK